VQVCQWFLLLKVAHITKQDTAVCYIEPLPAAPLILILQKPATFVSAGWESSLKIPGFGFYNLDLRILYPVLTEVGQIFVVDLDSFYPCKSLLIFPFHDFI
jgi:hypothetical protein